MGIINPYFISNAKEPVVTTDKGKIRGFTADGVVTFHGIQYARAGRFQSPEEVPPWDGLKDALSYGHVAPLLKPPLIMDEILIPHRYWPESEICQYLNIWTPTIRAEAKKPVMVWIHGGGYESGSSIEMVAYDGAALCKNGDVVVVSLNHRLNILGYFDLSAYGEKYRNSANAGNEDIVAALRWIRDNIAAFGGDPSNVTLFGQSGGGMKIIDLLQSPAADNLFHKAIIQSGMIMGFDMLSDGDPGFIVDAMLAELGISSADIMQLETIPYHALFDAYKKVAPAIAQAGHYIGKRPKPNAFYVGNPMTAGFRESANEIPLIIGSNFAEFPLIPAFEDKHEIPRQEVIELLRQKYADVTETVVECFERAYPGKHLSDLLLLDFLFRVPTQQFIAKRSEATAPTYSYMFAFDFPISNGRVAWHCAEIPFVFHNTSLVPVSRVPDVSEALEAKISGAWTAFAHIGAPTHKLLPKWPACETGNEVTMVFDADCDLRHNFDHTLSMLNMQNTPLEALFEAFKAMLI
jgi:para-nitrobenzyl esterase